jgi:predicted esterase
MELLNLTFLKPEKDKSYYFTTRSLVFYPEPHTAVCVSVKTLNVFLERLSKTNSTITLIDTGENVDCLKVKFDIVSQYKKIPNSILIDNVAGTDVDYILKNCIKDRLKDSQIPYDLTINKTSSYTHNNIEFLRLDINNRFAIYNKPLKKHDTYNLLVFYHGSRDLAWDVALNTSFINQLPDNFIVVFGQATLENLEPPSFHKMWGNITYGEIYWEIRDFTPEFTADIEYTKDLISNIKSIYNIDKIFHLGHSNGGVFNIQLAIYMPDVFTCIISHMGGIGYDMTYQLDFEKLVNNNTPIHFITAEYDEHKEPCIIAKRLFDSYGFKTSILEYPNLAHQYLVSNEIHIVDIIVQVLNKS